MDGVSDELQPPVTGGETASGPGAGPNAQDAVPAAATEPRPQTKPTTSAARLWMSVALATILLVLLIIFIAENSRSVTISFLGAHGHISLALALLIAAVVGAVVTLLAGTARILQLRREVRRSRRAHRGKGQRLQPR